MTLLRDDQPEGTGIVAALSDRSIPFASCRVGAAIIAGILLLTVPATIESAEPTSLTLAWEYATPQLFPQALVVDQKGRDSLYVALKNGGLGILDRSEERRVGKECRSRWSPYH